MPPSVRKSDLNNNPEAKTLLLPIWDGPFRFMDLPTELRLDVYRNLLPCERSISFNIPLNTTRRDHPVYHSKMWNCQGSLSLFLISKTIAQEALPILYGENEFTFNIASWSYPKNSLSSPLIFGPLGEPHRLHLIRNLRNIQIIFLVEMHRFPDHWTVARYRGRIEHFIKVLKQHVDDENQKSLLKTLRIKFCPPSTLMLHEHRSYVMYPLEALISMSGIENVSVEGVEDWFAKCLEMCIKGQGGDVKEIKWPMVRKKTRKADMHGSKNMYVTTRKWFQPELDWAEFAERNGISRAFSEYILPGHK